MYNDNNPIGSFAAVLRRAPDAVAVIRGSDNYPDIRGTVSFSQTSMGVIVCAEVFGLPNGGECENPVFAFHIHEGGECRGNEADPFADAMGHFNPDNCVHPHHAGDMPPLFSNDGYAFTVFLTDRFELNEIVGKAVIIHGGVDDFTSQPAGNAGEKIACGIIQK